MKKLIRGNKNINLSKFNSFNDYINQNKGNMSDSDAEDIPDNKLSIE